MRQKTTRTINVRVTTGASQPRVEEKENGSLRVYLKSAPEKGKANAELKEVVARFLGLRKSSVRVVRGFKSREKVIEVDT